MSLMKVKVLDNIQKSPVYSEFNAAITGLIPIRCYNQGGNFLRKFLKLVNNQSTTELSFFIIQRVMNNYMSFFANVTGLSATAIMIFVGSHDAEVIGFGIMFLMNFGAFLSYVIRVSM